MSIGAAYQWINFVKLSSLICLTEFVTWKSPQHFPAWP